MESRLDGLLVRNRNHALLDLALAALLLVTVVFTGVTLGAQLPKLGSSRRAVPAAIAGTASDAGRSESAQAALAPASPSGA